MKLDRFEHALSIQYLGLGLYWPSTWPNHSIITLTVNAIFVRFWLYVRFHLYSFFCFIYLWIFIIKLRLLKQTYSKLILGINKWNFPERICKTYPTFYKEHMPKIMSCELGYSNDGGPPLDPKKMKATRYAHTLPLLFPKANPHQHLLHGLGKVWFTPPTLLPLSCCNLHLSLSPS